MTKRREKINWYMVTRKSVTCSICGGSTNRYIVLHRKNNEIGYICEDCIYDMYSELGIEPEND